MNSYLVASGQKKVIAEDLHGRVSSFTRKAAEGSVVKSPVVILHHLRIVGLGEFPCEDHVTNQFILNG